mgnify:CR=1 FL=1|jgi:hypothetical protein|tara:strand:- start:913 stop:1410 length:498 start_codon:yes stop_codon:yes gene_type:complete
MALIIDAEFTGNCQDLMVNLTGIASGVSYKIYLKHVSDESSSETLGTIAPNSTTGHAFSGLSKGGLYQIEIRNQTTVLARKYVVSTCAVDKCLVLLTDKLLSCGCTSPACSAILSKAQKIMLLIKSAESTASRILREDDLVLVQDAQAQYRKAVQMCDGNCDCGC